MKLLAGELANLLDRSDGCDSVFDRWLAAPLEVGILVTGDCDESRRQKESRFAHHRVPVARIIQPRVAANRRIVENSQ